MISRSTSILVVEWVGSVLLVGVVFSGGVERCFDPSLSLVNFWRRPCCTPALSFSSPPPPTRRSDQLTYHQPEALVQAATFKSHCHSRLTLPSISADRWQRKSMESRRITFNIVTALSGVATLLSVKPPWRVTLLMAAASSSSDHLPSLLCDRHLSLIIKL
jgi:hypothetical protein